MEPHELETQRHVVAVLGGNNCLPRSTPDHGESDPFSVHTPGESDRLAIVRVERGFYFRPWHQTDLEG